MKQKALNVRLLLSLHTLTNQQVAVPRSGSDPAPLETAFSETTLVYFDDLTDEDILAYVATGSSMPLSSSDTA